MPVHRPQFEIMGLGVEIVHVEPPAGCHPSPARPVCFVSVTVRRFGSGTFPGRPVDVQLGARAWHEAAHQPPPSSGRVAVVADRVDYWSDRGWRPVDAVPKQNDEYGPVYGQAIRFALDADEQRTVRLRLTERDPENTCAHCPPGKLHVHLYSPGNVRHGYNQDLYLPYAGTLCLSYGDEENCTDV